MYEARGITKSYGGIPALHGVDFEVVPGEVHALLGMNGAGKSTLVRILVGAERPDQGRLLWDGEPIALASPRQAAEHAIAAVPQELNLFDDLTVRANLFANREYRRFGLFDLRRMDAIGAAALDRAGLDVDVRTPVAELTQAEKQRLAIARALLFEPRVLFLDEPTSALQAEETARFLGLVRSLRDRGTAIVYVSHFLEDVFTVADRLTVLRDGRVVESGVRIADATIPSVVRAMTADVVAGRAGARAPDVTRAERPNGAELRVDGLTAPGRYEDVSFRVRSGEIVGLAGLEGAGPREVLLGVFGAEPAARGSSELAGTGTIGRSMTASVARGVAYLPSDRQRSGAMIDASVTDNLLLVRVAALGRGGILLTARSLRRRAERRIARLGVKVDDASDALRTLSGGNQQKVMIGKWLEADARLFLLDDPTAAVDVHARAEIHSVIRALADDGAIVVIASSDLEELASLCDRVEVMRSGRIRRTLSGPDLTPHRLLESINTDDGAHAVEAGGGQRHG